MGVCLRDRELDSLIGPDRTSEDDPVASVGGRAIDKPAPVANRLGSDEDPLHVPAVDDVAKALAFLADAVLDRDLHILQEDGVGMVVDHHVQRVDLHVAFDIAHVHQEDGKPLGLVLQLLIRRCAGQQEHQVRLLRARDEDLLPVDDVAVSLANGARFDARGLRAGIRLGDGEGLQAEFALGDCGKIAPFLFLAAVAKQRPHGVHLGVAGAGVAARAVDFLEDDAGLGDAESRAAVLLRNQNREIFAGGERIDELLRVLLVLIDVSPICARETLAKFANRLANRLPILLNG